MTRTRAIHGYVEDETYDNWHDYAAVKAITVSALLEALGEEHGDELEACIPDRVIERARRIDARRRRRSAA